MPVLHLLAGPNGSGKSTYVAEVLQPITHLPFINADVIAAERWPGAQLTHAREASDAAAVMREELLARRESFITETVFSHPSKNALVEAASARGYLVHLHVMMVPVELSVRRVAERVRDGGHDVPEHKIRERHARLWALIARAREIADRTEIFDNSRASTPFRPVASYRGGSLDGRATWPAWAPTELID
ncbi:zeta toxin family protein [Microbacterium sediminicola]|uniref:Zeta toxin family protein n=1 Tax=Microbacterium sediminicola TaxID=415210 RepID=A0ABN2IJD5_9MICO